MRSSAVTTVNRAPATPVADAAAEEREPPRLDADLLWLGRAVAAVIAARDAELDAAIRRHEVRAACADAPVAPGRPDGAGRDVLLRELGLARQLCAALSDRPEQLDALDDQYDIFCADWLGDLPFELAEHGLLTEALGLQDALIGLLAADDLIGDRAMLLLRAGRVDEARGLAHELMQRFAGDPGVAERAAQLLRECGG